MPTKYVCLDTSILVRFATQGQPGCEREHWDKFLEQVSEAKVVVLLPEVVALEFEKNTATDIEAQFSEKMKGVENSLKDLVKDPEKSVKGVYWNEAGDMVKALMEHWEDLRRQKFAGFRTRTSRVSSWLQSTQQIPLTESIMLATKKRRVADRFFAAPGKDSSSFPENDCLIIDSLIAKLSGLLSSNELLLCTANLNDFGVKTGAGNSLHEAFKTGLPPTAIFADLKSLVAFIDEGQPVEEPSPDEVAAAEKAERQRVIEQSVEEVWNEYFADVLEPRNPPPRPVPRVVKIFKEVSGALVPRGRVVFLRREVASEHDYVCDPGNPITVEQARRIGRSLLMGVLQGGVDDLHWRVSWGQ